MNRMHLKDRVRRNILETLYPVATVLDALDTAEGRARWTHADLGEMSRAELLQEQIRVRFRLAFEEPSDPPSEAAGWLVRRLQIITRELSLARR